MLKNARRGWMRGRAKQSHHEELARAILSGDISRACLEMEHHIAMGLENELSSLQEAVARTATVSSHD